MHCGASVSELYRVFIGSMVVTYILHVCNMHNAQHDIYLGRAPSPISLRFANLSCLCSAVSAARRALSLILSWFCLSCDGFRLLLEVFRIYMFTTSSKTTIKSDYKSVRTCSQLDHAHSVRMRRTYACTGRMYDIYSEKFRRSTH